MIVYKFSSPHQKKAVSAGRLGMSEAELTTEGPAAEVAHGLESSGEPSVEPVVVVNGILHHSSQSSQSTAAGNGKESDLIGPIAHANQQLDSLELGGPPSDSHGAHGIPSPAEAPAQDIEFPSSPDLGGVAKEDRTSKEESPNCFNSGTAIIPHPEKMARGGEDPFFIDGTRWTGVANGFGGWAKDARALAPGACRFGHPVAANPLLFDVYLRSISMIPRVGYAARAKLRGQQSKRGDSDGEDLPWFENVDRHLPWPDRRPHGKDKEKEKKRKSSRSFKLRCEKYLKPFTLDIFLSNRFVHASIMHRALHKVVAVANSNAKEFRGTLPSYGDIRACWVIGKVLADRAKEADVFTVVYEPRRGEKLDNRIMTIVDTLVDNGIALELDKSN